MHDRNGRPTIVFLTVTTKERRSLLANREALDTVLAAWRRADTWRVGRYVILPDHLHLFCSPGTAHVSLVRWVVFWKSLVAKSWPRPFEKPLWQQDFWDRQLRCQESYQDKWEYVRQNPVRKGLVERAEDWPFAGEMWPLQWVGD